MKIENYRKKVMGCWLGKAVGGTLGMPFEGMDGPFDFTFYHPVPTGMVPNDDLDLQVVWACLLDQQEKPEVSRKLFSKAWKNNINFPWDEYGVCIRNLREGIEPPYSGSYDNWFINGMGAAIRSEIWACLAPGNPKLAAAYAYEDAILDHAEQGLWAEVWLAAMQSAAFVETDIKKIVQIGFEHIPADAEIRAAIEDTYNWWEKLKDWRKVRLQILEKYGHENFTNVTENMAFTLLALLDGNGDFSRSICTANNCGKDTDCTAATVGALLGILNPDGIDEKWLKPIGRELILSPGIENIMPPASLDAFTDLVLDLRQRLNGRFPPEAEPVQAPERSVSAKIGFAEVLWFGQGWQFNKPMKLDLPEMNPMTFPGTIGTYNSADFEAGMMFVEYTFELKKETSARVFFNTNENCRVFLNGSYVFGRECGRVAPSPHRIPINQAVDTVLPIGTHQLVAVMARSAVNKEIEWIVGVADRDDNDQWVPFAFYLAQP
jgi:ADP-ribosylglycohydrolase